MMTPILSAENVSEIHGICIYRFKYNNKEFTVETKRINDKLDIIIDDNANLPLEVRCFIMGWLREEF